MLHSGNISRKPELAAPTATVGHSYIKLRAALQPLNFLCSKFSLKRVKGAARAGSEGRGDVDGPSEGNAAGADDGGAEEAP